jgi:hypothetical protein
MTEPRITRLPSQATHGNTFGRYPNRAQVGARDLQREAERLREAYLVDGWQDDRPMV